MTDSLPQPWILDYHHPASDWQSEALPIGNGRLGAMLFGGLDSDRVQLNEASLWRGIRNYDNALNGDDERASDFGDEGFGSYQNLGWLEVGFNQARSGADYRRSLDLRTGRHRVVDGPPGQRLTRIGHSLFGADLIVLQYHSEQPLDGAISLTSAHDCPVQVDPAGLQFAGSFVNQLEFACRVTVLSCDGRLQPHGDGLRFIGATVLVLAVDAHTNYALDAAANWFGEPVAIRMDRSATAVAALADSPYPSAVDAAVARSEAHLAEIMDRCTMRWGDTPVAVLELPIDQRLTRYIDGGDDPGLEQVFVHYGRYLLACASRPGGLPANLQGIWNNSTAPAWGCDFHSNINIQMNYWGALPTGLTEQQLPLFDWVEQMVEPCRVATTNAFGDQTRGWTTRTGMSALGGHVWEWNVTGAAWLAQHFVEHWRFTGDDDFARQRVVPLLDDVAAFWLDRLVEVDGRLQAVDGYSPEHGPRENGVAYDQQILIDLFTGMEEVHAALGLQLRPEFEGISQRLAGPRIGSWGQLQEWAVDRDDPRDEHRHTSHLFAVYPGAQITGSGTPELAQAALVSLKARCGEQPDQTTAYSHQQLVGDSRRSWTWPWRMACFARLGDGQRAGEMLRGLLSYNTMPNLLCTHPPLQLDGNYGIVAAVAECLLQSHSGRVEVLPAVPPQWRQGDFSGLRARGGRIFDGHWDADGCWATEQQRTRRP